jgi:GNAT superfamily N-acetyltransferase
MKPILKKSRMTMVKIRPAAVSDLEHLAHLGVRFILSTPVYASLMQPDAGRIYALLAVALEQGVILVAEVNDYVVGGIALVVIANPISGDPTADEVAWFVAPEFRSSTIGPRLLGAAEDWCAAHGATTIKMIAPAGSAVGEYYARRGYVAVETAYAKKVPHGMVDAVRMDGRAQQEHDRADGGVRRASGPVGYRRAAATRTHHAADGPTDSTAADRDERFR